MPFTLTGSDVKRLREIAGVTQRELGDALGYDRSAISRWERHPDKSIPRARYGSVLDFIRARYDLAEGQRVQLTSFQRAANA